MPIPSTDREELVGSSLGAETLPQNVTAKGTLWTLQKIFGRFLLQEYAGYSSEVGGISPRVFILTPALRVNRTIEPNYFWVWAIDHSNNLTLYEVEPFTNAPPTITYSKSITTNALELSCFVKENDAVRLLVLYNAPTPELKTLTYSNVKTVTTPSITDMQWGATRLNSFSNFVNESNTLLKLSYAIPGSPPNIYTENYTVPVPQNLSGYQLVGTFSAQLSWDTSIGSDQYVLERATDSAFAQDLVTIYTGPNTSFLDATPGPDTYYYRVKAQVNSILLESPYSTALEMLIIITSIDFIGVPTSGQVPLDVHFTYLGSTVPGITYLWEFGDTETSSLENPLHTYNDIGNFTVTLTITVPGGSAHETKLNYINVFAVPPAADFTASPIDDEYPLVVQFTDTSTCPYPITAWYWQFGDGGTSTEQNPIHTYNTPGLYTVSLTATNTYGLQDTETKPDYIRARGINLIVDFVGVPRDGESPLVVDFTNLTQVPAGYSVLGWHWDFGDGEYSQEENPTHIYIREGFFTVTLRAYVEI